jgi:thermitase
MRLIKTLVAVALLLSASTVRFAAQTPSAGPFVSGEVLVKFRPGASASAKADVHRVAGGTMLAEIARTGVQRVAVPAGDESAAIARYQRNPNVLYAEPNFIRRIPVVASHSSGSLVVPGDYHFDEQWALHNTGQEFYCFEWIDGEELCFYIAKADADIDAPEAWAISTGAGGEIVKVAVIDTGIDYNHPDLVANYAGGDDFTSGDGDPMDDHGHGTHVAGSIAAAISNLTGTPAAEEGVVGVAPNARILAYKVCTADGSCTDFAIEDAIAQAIVDGAKVISMSLGGPDFSQSTFDAVQDAWNAGLVVVAAAGNSGNTSFTYPGAYANVVSVGAFDEDHKRAPFSNYGTWVDISAPGNVVMSTYPLRECGGLATVPGDTGCYTWNSGTSMATPHVSGAAALVWTRSDVTTNSQVVEILLNSADPRGVDAVRLDSWTIHGGLNLHNAMSYGSVNLSPQANAGPDQTVTDSDGNGAELIALDGSASVDPDGSIVSYEWREGGALVATGATPSVLLSTGMHTLTLEVTDNHGSTGADSVVVTVNPPSPPPNTAPVAADTSATTEVGTPVTVTLSATDAGTCELTFAVVQGPTSGALGAIEDQACVGGAPNSDTARITYTPGGTAGTYSFTYTASDGSAVSNVATVTLIVNPAAPVGVTVTGIDPNVVRLNAGVTTFRITGTGFAEGASLAFENGTGQTPRVISVARDSSTQLTASVEIRSGGPRKNRSWDVRVTNPDGSTGVGVGLLTITP